ncbi:MAG: trehalose-6-phosphate synthase, partial [Mesorhizobium sp.]
GDALLQALTMSPEEQRQRMRRMREVVRENNVYRWAGSMLFDAARLRKRDAVDRAVSAAPRSPGPSSPGNVISLLDRKRVAAL